VQLLGGPSLPQGEAKSLTKPLAPRVWDKRELLKDVRGDPLETRASNSGWMRTCSIWARSGWTCCVRLAEPGKVNAAHEEALQILADTEVLFGASHVLCRQRQASAIALGKAELAQAAASASQRRRRAPPGSITHWADRCFNRGQLDKAALSLEKALRHAAARFLARTSIPACALTPKASGGRGQRLPGLHRAGPRERGLLLQSRPGRGGARAE